MTLNCLQLCLSLEEAVLLVRGLDKLAGVKKGSFDWQAALQNAGLLQFRSNLKEALARIKTLDSVLVAESSR